MGAQAHHDEPARFVDAYVRAHGLEGDLRSDALADVLVRADAARERFKRTRSAEAAVDHAALTQSEKYRRRLENNKKSAAATRVYNEVLRKESARALRDLERAERAAREELAVLRARLDRAERILAAHAAQDYRFQPAPATAPPLPPASAPVDQSVPRRSPSFIDADTTLRPLHDAPPPAARHRSPTIEPQPRAPSPRRSRASLPFRPPTGLRHPAPPVPHGPTSPMLPPPLRCEDMSGARPGESMAANRVGDATNWKRQRTECDESESRSGVGGRWQ